MYKCCIQLKWIYRWLVCSFHFSWFLVVAFGRFICSLCHCSSGCGSCHRQHRLSSSFNQSRQFHWISISFVALLGLSRMPTTIKQSKRFTSHNSDRRWTCLDIDSCIYFHWNRTGKALECAPFFIPSSLLHFRFIHWLTACTCAFALLAYALATCRVLYVRDWQNRWLRAWGPWFGYINKCTLARFNNYEYRQNERANNSEKNHRQWRAEAATAAVVVVATTITTFVTRKQLKLRVCLDKITNTLSFLFLTTHSKRLPLCFF